jgi:hypothetical protein
MARAQTKQELLDFGEREYTRLMELIGQFSSEQQVTVEIFEGHTVKDVLAHLHDWQMLLFTWEDEGRNGGRPAVPAPGYTWKDLPALNDRLYRQSKDADWETIARQFAGSHAEAMRRISAYSAEDLETKAKFKWTGSTSIASYYASATSSHYVWAAELVKKRLKALK